MTHSDSTTCSTAGEVSLCVVVPAHNELAVIETVLREIVAVAELLTEAGNFEILVVDDASTDGTAELLDDLDRRISELTVVHLPMNVGHGPALRAGWDLADADWIAHLDSDGEIETGDLAALWNARHEGDLLLGVRVGRTDTPHRRFVTHVLRYIARLAAGRELRDANTPCKLVRRRVLVDAMAMMPDDAFAPSILLAVTVARTGGKIVEVPVRSRTREHGTSWLVPTRLLRGSARATFDTGRVTWWLWRGRIRR